MCFAPQRRALFRHRSFQKVFRTWGVFSFLLANVLRATTECNFSHLIWPAGSAPAALASLLFDPPEPQILEKQSVSRLSYLCAHLDLLSSDAFSFWSSFFFSSLLFSYLPFPSLPFPFPSLLFSSLTFSDSSHLCFSSVHIVGSLTLKLPSNVYVYTICVYYIYSMYIYKYARGLTFARNPWNSMPGCNLLCCFGVCFSQTGVLIAFLCLPPLDLCCLEHILRNLQSFQQWTKTSTNHKMP